MIAKSKLDKPFTKSHHATSTYYNFPAEYECAKFKKWAKIGSEKSSELLSTDNEQRTCSQLWHFTGNPPKCDVVDNKFDEH